MKTGILGIALGSAIVLSGGAFAADIAVPSNAPTIQAAIDLAETGDRVLVAPGTYSEAIDFSGKAITVESTDGAPATIIDGGEAVGYVVTFASGEDRGAVLRGFTITGGFGEAGSNGAGPGGGILIESASPRIEDSVLLNNSGIFGGGVSIIDGDPVISNTRFEANSALHGGGLYIETGELTLENSEFIGNSATNNGGGAAILWLSTAEIIDTTFTGNTASSFGAGLYANHATLNAERITVADNGEIEALDDGVSFIINTFGGGGIYTTDTSGRINASRILNNNSAAGTGIYIAGSGTLEITNTLIAENGTFCNCGTGAVYANSSSPTIINSTIVNNGGFSGIFTTYNAFPSVANSILAGQQNALDSQNPTAGNGETTLSFCLLEGSPAAAQFGSGNIFAVPQLDAEADYALLPGSPGIDAGDNTAVPADITTDLLGNDRFVDDPDSPDGGNGNGPIVDIGAIEFGAGSPDPEPLMGDMNSDGVVGPADLLMLMSAWGSCSGDCPADMNLDGQVNALDLIMLLANWG